MTEQEQVLTAEETPPTPEEAAPPPKKKRQPPKRKPAPAAAVAGWVATDPADAAGEPGPTEAAPAAPADADDAPPPFVEPPPQACVGRPVQYCQHDGTVIPGVLQSRARTNKWLWNVKVQLEGATILTMRAEVRYSPTPKPGCWSLLPE